MADPEDNNDDTKAKKAKAEKAAAEPQAPAPSQEEADSIKERIVGAIEETREVKAQSSKSSYKTR
jgi:hypothetical protein